MSRLRILVPLVVLALVAASCGGSGDSDDALTAGDESTTTTIADGELPADIIRQLDATPVPDTDIALPDAIPATPAGAPGYSHYVFQEFNGEIVPTMVEGPRDGAVRCDQIELPCSYGELLALADSGDPIPPELQTTREELEELAVQLRQVSTALERYADPDLACQDGFGGQPIQVPNMGSHWWNIANVVDGVFDPSKPEIILYGVADNLDPEGAFSGSCVDGEWTGDRELVVMGASFFLPPEMFGNDHPDGFATDLDIWHVHYNLCNTFIPVPNKEACDDLGGQFAETTGWMNHVWTNTDFDNQLGAFTMWNASVWPVTDPVDVRDRFEETLDDPNYRSIENFGYGDKVTVAAGEEVRWANTDAVPHTVTSDDGVFDTGVFGPGVVQSLTIEEEGDYNFYCALHPGMVGSITVEG
jgi:hypothetical protein